MNLDVTVDVETNVNVGEVVYTLSTSEPDVFIEMMALSSVFRLDGSKYRMLMDIACWSIGRYFG